jgi:hypothetical protein
MARLSAAETALSKQAESLSILTRQVDKVQIRTRLVSRDMRDQVKEIQALTETHGEALLGAGEKLSQLESEVRGLEELIDAVQGIAAKQFRLIASVVGQGSQQKAPIAGNTSKASGTKKKVGHKIPPATAAAAPLAAKHPQQKEEVAKKSDKTGRDEWGRVTARTQSLQIEKEGEKEEEVASAAAILEAAETAPVAAISIDDGRQMKLNEDGSVSFSF